MKFGTILRLAAIALGIVSATIMAQRGFEISFNEDFLAFLNVLGEIVGAVVTPFELLFVNPIVSFLSSSGFQIELHSH